MAARPLISVIMIFLNEERFIQEAIQSVLAQTYENLELILVDDGSIDESTTIAKRYAKQYPDKMRYLEHPDHANRGMSPSRNLGIHNARGAFLTFIDADDVIYPQRLERQITILCSHPDAALVCGRAQWWYSWTGKQEEGTRDFVQVLNVDLDTVVHPPALLSLFLQDEWASLCDVMVRKEAVDAVGGYEASFQGMYEDQAFHAKLCLAFPAFVASDVWYRYRQHPHACSSVSHETGQYTRARQGFLTWLEGYFAEQGVGDLKLREILRKEIWRLRHPFLRGILRRTRHNVFLMKSRGRQIAYRALLSTSDPGSGIHGVRKASVKPAAPAGFNMKVPPNTTNRIAELLMEVDKLVKTIMEQNAQVVGILLTGGLARGFADRFSDVDIEIFYPRGYTKLILPERPQGGYWTAQGNEVEIEKSCFEEYMDPQNDEMLWDMKNRWDKCHATILYDPKGQIENLLKTKVVFRPGEWEKLHKLAGEGPRWLAMEVANSWTERGDIAAAHHVVNCAINLLLDYLFLMNKQFIPDDKWKLFYAKQLETLPENFEQRIHQSMLVGEFTRQELQRRQSVFVPLVLDVQNQERKRA